MQRRGFHARVGLTADVPCLQCTSWMQVWITKASSQAVETGRTQGAQNSCRLSEVPTLQPLLLLNMPSAVATPLLGMRPQ